ncbi:hypothetical protein [Haloarcula ordinaria]|uniref:hypothetical protein n=2 Tax=Haloarcula TaxID=2237 RepID=UPI0023E7F3B5|nr:hypothetical protein [Halomicroarcula sp. ZS-22-S1]
MSQSGTQNPSARKVCGDCGQRIETSADLCPACGATQADDSSSTTPDRYGFLFAVWDAMKRHNTIRTIANLVFIPFSAGTYLAILAIEGFIHYRHLNAGNVEPYEGDAAQRVWVIPMNPSQYQLASDEPSTAESNPETTAETLDNNGTTSPQPSTETTPQPTTAGREVPADWLADAIDFDDTLTLVNRSESSVHGSVGIRTREETVFTDKFAVAAGEREELTAIPVAEVFEVGVNADGGGALEAFSSDTGSPHDIQVEFTGQDISISEYPTR